MRRSARIQGKLDDQSVAVEENWQKIARKTRGSLEADLSEKKPLMDILNVVDSRTEKKSMERTKVTRSGRHFSPFVITRDSDTGSKTVKTKPSAKNEEKIRRKTKEKTGKVDKRKLPLNDSSKENHLQQPTVLLTKPGLEVKERKTTGRRALKEQNAIDEKPIDVKCQPKPIPETKTLDDLPPFSIKDYPGPFFPLDEALQFDEEAIENSLTSAELAEIRRTLKRREEKQVERGLSQCLKSAVFFNKCEGYGVFKSIFKDINSQMLASDAMTGQIVPPRDCRRPRKFDIMEVNLGKQPEPKRLYRKNIMDEELMAWHRYNVATSSRCSPPEEEPPFVLRCPISQKSPRADLIWRMNQTRRVPTVNELFEDEETLKEVNSGTSVVTVSSDSLPGDDESLVFDPKEFTSSTPETKK